MNSDESSGQDPVQSPHRDEVDQFTSIVPFAETNATLTHFSVHLGTGGGNNRVFANGLQRLRLIVQIRKQVFYNNSWRNGNLSPAERQSLAVVSGGGQVPPNWQVHRDAGSFRLAGPGGPASHSIDVNEQSASASTIPLNPNAEEISFFVSTNQVGGVANWHATITLDLPDTSGNRSHVSIGGTVQVVGEPPIRIWASDLEHREQQIWDSKEPDSGTWRALVTHIYRFRPQAPLMRNQDGSENRFGPPLSVSGGGVRSRDGQPRPAYNTFFRNDRRIMDYVLPHSRHVFSHAEIVTGYPRGWGLRNGPNWDYGIPTEWNIRTQIYYEGATGDGRFDPHATAPITIRFQDVYGTFHDFRLEPRGNGIQLSNS